MIPSLLANIVHHQGTSEVPGFYQQLYLNQALWSGDISEHRSLPAVSFPTIPGNTKMGTWLYYA